MTRRKPSDWVKTSERRFKKSTPFQGDSGFIASGLATMQKLAAEATAAVDLAKSKELRDLILSLIEELKGGIALLSELAKKYPAAPPETTAMKLARQRFGL